VALVADEDRDLAFEEYLLCDVAADWRSGFDWGRVHITQEEALGLCARLSAVFGVDLPERMWRLILERRRRRPRLKRVGARRPIDGQSV
jgi:hypothetical protein